MKAKVFKSTGAIIVYGLVTIGLIAIAGYNWWGWFGGSDSWKAKDTLINSNTDSGNKRGKKAMSGMCWCGIEPHWLFGCRKCPKE